MHGGYTTSGETLSTPKALGRCLPSLACYSLRCRPGAGLEANGLPPLPLLLCQLLLDLALPRQADIHGCVRGKSRVQLFGDAANGVVTVIVQPLVAVGVADVYQPRAAAPKHISKLLLNLARVAADVRQLHMGFKA